jgi:chromosome segregation ATPase
MSTRASHVEKLKAQLVEWRADLDRLEAEARRTTSDGELRYQKEIAELRQKAEEAQETLQKIKEGDEDAWNDLKKGAENMWGAFKKSFVKAKSEFKRGYKEGMDD